MITFIVLLSIPLGSRNPADLMQPLGISDQFSPASSVEYYVNNNSSDTDLVPDKGSHSAFPNQRFGPDSMYDVLTEEDTSVPGENKEPFVEQISDLHTPLDKGSHSNFTAMRYYDSVSNALTEADQGSGAVDEWCDVDGAASTLVDATHVGTSPYLDAQDNTSYITLDKGGAYARWYTFTNTSGQPGPGYVVNMSVYLINADGDDDLLWYIDTNGDDIAEFTGQITDPTSGYYSTGTIVGLDTQTEVNSARLMLEWVKTAGIIPPQIDHARLGVSKPVTIAYELDLEVGWTSADFDEENEELCIYPITGGGWPAEDIRVDVWNGSWINVYTDLAPNAWNNISIGSYLTDATFEIRFVGGMEGFDSTQDTWEIDTVLLHVWTVVPPNHELDLEVQWTGLPFSETNEDLCIFTGPLAVEDIRVDVWNGTGWTNLLTDLVAGSWNNISVKTWLVLPTLTIRYSGGVDISDTVQSSWFIDAALVHLYNNVPENDQQPIVSNVDDVDNMYAHLREYQITMYASDADGYENIRLMRLSLYSDNRATLYWTLEYDENLGFFSEVYDPSDYVQLNVTGSSVVNSSSDLDATFQVSISWNHPDIPDADAQCYVLDERNENSTDWYEVNWDIETRLDTSGIAVDDKIGTQNRGNIDGWFYVSGTVTYLGSLLSPPSDAVDIWVNSTGYGTNPGPWSDTNLDSGQFNVTCFADDVAGLNNYSIKAVEEGLGANGADLFQSPTQVDYISDSITVSISLNDSRIDVGTNATIEVNATYDHDSQLYDGDLLLNNTVFTYSDVGRQFYTVTSASFDLHGVSAISTNQVASVIWDRLRVDYSSSDDRCDINTVQSVYVTVEYEFDSTPLTDSLGTIQLNGTLMTWESGPGRWSKSYNYSDPTFVSFTVTSLLDTQYDITSVNYTEPSIDIIWDRLQVQVSSDAAIVTYGVQVNFTVTATRQADGSLVSQLLVTTNKNGTFFNSSTSFFDVEYGPTETVSFYVVVSASDSEYDLSVFISNQLEVRWTDRPAVAIDEAFTDDPDGRVNVNTTVSIYFHCIWSTNGSAIDTGMLYVNLSPHPIDSTGWVRFNVSSATVDRILWNVTGADVNTVTEYDMRVALPAVIWDSLIVMIDVDDSRINVGENASISLSAVYDYDGTPYEGNLILNDTVTPQFTVGIQGYTVASATGGLYGITMISVNSEVFVIWDSLVIDIFATHRRIDVGAIAIVNATANYSFDGATFDGVLILNETVMQLLSPGRLAYTVSSAGLDTFNISVIEENDDEFVIWDRMEVYWSETERERVAVGANVEVRFKVRYEYDGALFTGVNRELQVDDLDATYRGVGNYWYLTVSKDSVGAFGYEVTGFSDSTSAVTVLVNASIYATIAVFDAVYVEGAGVWDDPASIALSGMIEAHSGDVVTLYFYLKYQSDDSDVAGSGTVVRVNQVPAAYVAARGRWEISVTSAVVNITDYEIDSFEDAFGITQIEQGQFVPRISWLPPLVTGPPMQLLLAGAAGAVILVALLVSSRRRVAKLEGVLTPEELLTLSDVGMSDEMRRQTVANLEWLKGLSSDIPHMTTDVLSVVWEELEKAHTMYERAFELEPVATEAGEQLRKTLLERIDFLLGMIDREVESRR
jgi:hypothetical protein